MFQNGVSQNANNVATNTNAANEIRQGFNENDQFVNYPLLFLYNKAESLYWTK